jgi:riboflavin kinase/FMN adenylyltransferase
LKVHQGLENFSKLDKAVVTTGTFDGVHIGHQHILKKLKETAQKIGGESVLLTFYPHPRMVLQEHSDLRLINTIEEKTELLRAAGVDHLIIHPFTREFSRTTSLEYVRDILVNQIGTVKLVIGYDHHFGRNREGSFEHLKEYGPIYGFEVEEISAQDIDDVKVSSTKIRAALEDGDVETANSYLGKPFPLSGEVVKGDQIGRELGYPTANLKLSSEYKLIPPNGIYAVKVKHEGKEYNGMLNIGVRPTFEFEDPKQTLEVHLLDFKGDLYGKYLSLELIKRIRDEKKFDNRQKLIEEIEKDEVRIRNFFRT